MKLNVKPFNLELLKQISPVLYTLIVERANYSLYTMNFDQGLCIIQSYLFPQVTASDKSSSKAVELMQEALKYYTPFCEWVIYS